MIEKRSNERQSFCRFSDLYFEDSENNTSVSCEERSECELFRCWMTSLACNSDKVMCARRVSMHEIFCAIITQIFHRLILKSVNEEKVAEVSRLWIQWYLSITFSSELLYVQTHSANMINTCTCVFFSSFYAAYVINSWKCYFLRRMKVIV